MKNEELKQKINKWMTDKADSNSSEIISGIWEKADNLMKDNNENSFLGLLNKKEGENKKEKQERLITLLICLKREENPLNKQISDFLIESTMKEIEESF